MLNSTRCPLCQGNSCKVFDFILKEQTTYWVCETCALIFMDRGQTLNNSEEKQRYELHENSIEDEKYLQFVGTLKKLMAPTLEGYIQKYATTPYGLDYGSGKAAPLAYLYNQDGLNMDAYDLYYKPLELRASYDFIVATELIEHIDKLHNLLSEWVQLLEPNGLLGIKSFWYREDIAFTNWHYRLDPTHISFLTQETLLWVEQNFPLKLISSSAREVVYQKKSCK